MKVRSENDRLRIEAAAEANMAENRRMIAEYQARAGMSESGTAAYTAAYARGREVGIKAERERVRAILSCSEAHERQKFARHLAFDTDTDIEAAKKLLSLAAREPSDNQFARAMARITNPKVGVSGDDIQVGTGSTFASEIYAKRAKDRERAYTMSGDAAVLESN